jgi:hypothetical protein
MDSAWAETLTNNVYEKWKSDYSFWEPGFKVFYSPIVKNIKKRRLDYISEKIAELEEQKLKPITAK